MRPLLCLILLVLAGCGPRFEAHQACTKAAGPAPYAMSSMFGAVGSLVAEAQPERQAWNTKVERCMTERLAGR